MNAMNRLLTATALLLITAMAPNAFAHEKHAGDHDQPLNYFENDRGINILIDGKLFTAYHYKDAPKPYLYPIIGPTGSSMTRHYPMRDDVEGEAKDHPHHRAFWFAHGSVGGQDFWHEKKNSPVIKSAAKPNVTLTGGTSLDISTSNHWLTHDGKQIASDQTLIRISQADDESRIIDYITTITGQPNEPLVFGDTKEGMMAMRLHPALRLKGKVATGQATNSNGEKDGQIWGKRAEWVAYWGQVDGKTVGMAIFDHPENLRHPTYWHARDYGLVAANPFGISDFEKGTPKGTGDYTLDAGKQLILRYRFVFFEGTAEDADIAGKYKSWSTPKVPAKNAP